MKLTFPARLKVNKTWAVLGAALAIGLLAALATRSFLSTQVAAIEARNQHQMVSVVVAKTELAQNTVLSNQNVAVRKIPLEYAHSGAVLPADFERIDGNSLAFQVKPGEMIMWSQMAGKRAPTFSARLAQGQRAITVVVDEINSISGMLEPGDLIDLMFTIDQNGRKMVVPLLQSMQVMATGQRSVDDPKSGERMQFATVTLDATPEQARNIILARETGKLTALLRNPADNYKPGDNYDLGSLFGTQPEGNPISASRTIPVLYGGSGAKYPSEALHLGRNLSSDIAFPPPPAAAPVPVPAPAAGVPTSSP
ncbi:MULTISPECIES: Flp pilus assembly protein CpaB [unclassified Janthinobacterium]|uniref:Flp pilus assembly protein CpaB n=1 Tax=unclassified Janthinobacterium TaxID=2610881 RepID=UPI0016192661|nr:MULTISPECIES: Flp pilus assembly protein CpaB [unclassified Janthinobacterium]MBB5606649.1 pilus assembly protein CpaB [Janthinobacterium sp. S3T4]MBB5612301.1 pilus assembly protein CpaB [Janthinobacterium sp. S3M3]